MKLLLCPICQDVRKLLRSVTTCMCGASWGYYKNGTDAVVGGKTIPLGFANHSLINAIRNRRDKGEGERFQAFVIPRTCPTIKQNPSAPSAESRAGST